MHDWIKYPLLAAKNSIRGPLKDFRTFLYFTSEFTMFQVVFWFCQLKLIVFDHVWSPPLYQRQYWFHTLATLLFYMDIQDSKCNILLVCVFDAILSGNRQSPHAGSRTSPTTARIIATFVDFAAVCRIIALCVPIPGPQRNSHSKAKLVTLAALS